MFTELPDNQFENSSILLIIPVFNDWESLELLLMHLDEVFKEGNVRAEVLVVDDASSISAPDSFKSSNFKAINKVYVLELRRNLGHQRAIAIGLAYVEANIKCQAVVVMDGDGEDAPRDVLRLIVQCDKEGYEKIVFARRTKRSESQMFKIFYLIYKWLYKLLTGQEINVGNFSIIPYKILRRIVVVSEIWNHYAAGIFKAKLPSTHIPCKRGVRLAGQSKMKFVSLVSHGLSAISVYGDIIGVRFLVAIFFLMLFSVSLIAVILVVRIAIPNWAPYVAGLSFIILLQSMTISLSFVFLILNGRNNFGFLPKRDYHYFILDVQQVFPEA